MPLSGDALPMLFLSWCTSSQFDQNRLQTSRPQTPLFRIAMAVRHLNCDPSIRNWCPGVYGLCVKAGQIHIVKLVAEGDLGTPQRAVFLPKDEPSRA